jgi:hypothetical protein
MTEDVVNHWRDSPQFPTLYLLDCPVLIHVARVFSGLGIRTRRQDELPLWIRGCGLRPEPWMRGRQIAWMRRSSLHCACLRNVMVVVGQCGWRDSRCGIDAMLPGWRAEAQEPQTSRKPDIDPHLGRGRDQTMQYGLGR